MAISRELLRPEPIPDRFQNPQWRNPSIQPELFKRFLGEIDVTDRFYLSKNHIRSADLRTLLLTSENVRVLNITRDLRDVLVSAYYHDRREGGADGTIDEYWHGLGRKRITGVLKHHQIWNTGHEQVFVMSYEALQTSFVAQVEALAAFLGVEEVDVERIAQSTNFDRLHSLRPDFFRRGIVGGWRDHLSRTIMAELTELSSVVADLAPSKAAPDDVARSEPTVATPPT
jgi:hypothetical protein